MRGLLPTGARLPVGSGFAFSASMILTHKGYTREKQMNRYDRLYTKLAGITLIIGPLLIVCAALAAAAGIGTTTGRWYDNWLEGILMVLGFALQLIGLLALCRRIGATRPILGMVTMLTSVLGTAGALFPSIVRVLSASELALGITVEQLDAVHGDTSETPIVYLLVIPFILCFFLTQFLLAFGLWRTQVAPRYAPVLLAIGSIAFIIGQGTSAEVNWLFYVVGVTAWLLVFAPLGISMLRGDAGSSMALADTAVLS